MWLGHCRKPPGKSDWKSAPRDDHVKANRPSLADLRKLQASKAWAGTLPFRLVLTTNPLANLIDFSIPRLFRTILTSVAAITHRADGKDEEDRPLWTCDCRVFSEPLFMWRWVVPRNWAPIGPVFCHLQDW